MRRHSLHPFARRVCTRVVDTRRPQSSRRAPPPIVPRPCRPHADQRAVRRGRRHSPRRQRGLRPAHVDRRRVQSQQRDVHAGRRGRRAGVPRPARRDRHARAGRRQRVAHHLRGDDDGARHGGVHDKSRVCVEAAPFVSLRPPHHAPIAARACLHGTRRAVRPATPCADFNLGNYSGAGTVLDHVLTAAASSAIAVDAALIPTGVIEQVATSFWLDFRTAKALGKDITHGTVSPSGGYDNALLFDGWAPGGSPVVRVNLYAPGTGIGLEMSTDQASVQVYSGNGASRAPGRDPGGARCVCVYVGGRGEGGVLDCRVGLLTRRHHLCPPQASAARFPARRRRARDSTSTGARAHWRRRATLAPSTSRRFRPPRSGAATCTGSRRRTACTLGDALLQWWWPGWGTYHLCGGQADRPLPRTSTPRLRRSRIRDSSF